MARLDMSFFSHILFTMFLHKG